jgi:hypothetical protein
MQNFDEKYPHVSAWVQDGNIEIGHNDYDKVFLRVMDAGGVIWESDKSYPSLDDAFAEMDAAIADWCEENGVELDM